jgi:aspartyl-tRNA(Asn)/glutamyl-tRNA(Gln) amidotransferase subunit A
MGADGLTIAAAARALRDRRVSSQTLTEQCLAAIAERGRELNAFITVTADDARKQALAADRDLAAGLSRGPLHGIPISLKDLIDVEGVATTAASRVREGHVAAADATVTARLRQAGAVFVGKTNLHEFAFGTTNEDSAYGPARHPLDPRRSPGGSSGGSAISVATGMALASLGTDTGGSIRIPAAACGLVGLKPSSGEIPVDGVVPLSATFDHVGPICRSVEDAQLMYDVLRGAAPSAAPAFRVRDTRKIQAGVPRDYFLSQLDEEVASVFASACARLTSVGVTLSDVRVAHTDTIGPVYTHVSIPEAAAYHAATLERIPDRYTPNVRVRLEAGRYLLAEDYVRARQGCHVLRLAVDAALAGADALLLPTLAIPAPPIGAATVRIGERDEQVRSVMLRLTNLFNITGHPAIAIPCGTTRAGLPVSAQLVGRLGQTSALLEVARALEPHLTHHATL